jgi:NAD dependent epimerase/dehydratase
MELTGKKVFITGANGFIGSHLTERLVDLGAHVRALVQYNSQNKIGNLIFLKKEKLEKIEIVFGDIKDTDLMKQMIEGCEIVFHLAALIAIPYSYLAPEAYVQTNTLGTLHLLQACRVHGVKKILHTSTSEVYGTAQYIPIDEKHPLQAQSPYAATKIGADKMAESFFKSFNLPVTVIRPFNTFGPRQSDRAIIPTIISQIATGKKKIKLGSLEPIRDFLYVKDTVTGYIKVAESDQCFGEVVNLGTGRGISMGELARLIMILMKTEIDIVSREERMRPQKSEVMQLICDYNKVKKMVGWSPSFSLEEGLLETIEFIKKNLKGFNPDQYNI